jgi:DtxR family transcriptional regulator, Mn-dependent transcriptional regulator
MKLNKDTAESAGHNSVDFENTHLSATMEDYLETISLLSGRKKVVRVKDIAKSLGITMPSVTAALARLKERNLINYEKYGYVELTGEGGRLAEAVYRKHSFLNDFFHHVLGMRKSSAEKDACTIEHHLSPEACRQIYRLVEFYKNGEESGSGWTSDLRLMMDVKPLSELHEGESAVIIKVEADNKIRHRLIEMGFRKGEQVKIIKYAPLRDPMEITIKGYHISLRTAEACMIFVRPVSSGGDPADEGENAGE